MSDISSPLAAPTNYSGLQVQADPVGSFLKSQALQSTMDLQKAQAQQAQSGAVLQTAQAKLTGAQTNTAAYQLQRQQMYPGMLQQAMANPTASNFAALASMFPDQHAGLTEGWNMIHTAQQQAEVDGASRAYAALQNGRPDLALNEVTTHLDALQNSGADPSNPQYQKQVQDAQTLKNLIQTDPKMAQGHLGAVLSSAMGPQDFASHFSTLMTTPATIGKANAEATTAGATASVAPQAAQADLAQKQATVANTISETQQRAANFGLDQQKFQTDTALKMAELRYKTQFPNLPDKAQTDIADSVGQAQMAQMSADRAEGIAGRIEADPNYGSGVLGKANAAVQDFFGNQDESNNLRKEYTAMRTNAIFSQIQGGRTTDNDLKVINQGFPDANANTTQISTFLHSFANVQRRMAVYQDAKSDWLSNVGSMGKTPHDVSIQGVMVPQGTTFNDYMKRGAPNAVPAVTPPSAGPGQDVPAYMKYGK